MWNISSQNLEDIFWALTTEGPPNVPHFFTTKPGRRNFDNFRWNPLIAACVFSLEDIFDKNINFDSKCDRKN